MIIPKEIFNEFKKITGSTSAEIKLRALSDLDNKLGETYMLGANTTIVFFYGKLGHTKECMTIELDEISSARVGTKPPFAFLELKTDDDEMRIKFAMFELGKVKQFIKLWKEVTGGPKDVETTADDAYTETVERSAIAATIANVDYTPIIGFSAALHAMAFADNELAEEELKNLELIIPDKDAFDKGQQYWRNKGTDVLIKELSTQFTELQKRCLLANLMDLSMVDGTLTSSEQEFLQFVCTSFEITDDDFQAMFDFLYFKNNTAIFVDP